jgi:hypothetical protein
MSWHRIDEGLFLADHRLMQTAWTTRIPHGRHRRHATRFCRTPCYDPYGAFRRHIGHSRSEFPDKRPQTSQRLTARSVRADFESQLHVSVNG